MKSLVFELALEGFEKNPDDTSLVFYKRIEEKLKEYGIKILSIGYIEKAERRK